MGFLNTGSGQAPAWNMKEGPETSVGAQMFVGAERFGGTQVCYSVVI